MDKCGACEEFPLEEGGSILVQIDEPEIGGTVRAGREETIEKATDLHYQEKRDRLSSPELP